MEPVSRILVGFTVSDARPAGTIWMIEAANTDFYLKAVGGPSLFHLSVHGPSSEHDGHRFHVKVDGSAAAKRARRGQFIAHGIPEDGQVFRGVQVGPNAFLVARLRWLGELKQPDYRAAAVRHGDLPSLSFKGRSGRKLSWPLRSTEAADVDLVISYDKPFWPDAAGSLRDNARLGPLRNSSGMHLTGTAYRRSQPSVPSPQRLIPRLPAAGETPTRLMCSGPSAEAGGEMYWFRRRHYVEGAAACVATGRRTDRPVLPLG